MGLGTSFLVYFKAIHFTCLIFVSNNCFQDHRIIKSVTIRLISIFCILTTSGITCLVLIASQIKDTVLLNNLKTKRKCWKRFSTKFYQFCYWNGLTEQPVTYQNRSFFTFLVLKIEAELKKILKFFHNSGKHLFVLHHAKFHGNSPKNHKVTAIYILRTLNIPLI